MEKLKKAIRSRPFQAIAVILIIFIIAVLCTLMQSRTCIIKTGESQYFRAGSIFIMGNTILCRRDKNTFEKKEDALTGEPEYQLAILRIADTAIIEFVTDVEPEKEDGPVPAHFLGTYNINVAAHQGYLSLWSKDGRAYGSIRFPNWARGVPEPLKGVYISGDGNIRFTRSVTTRAEQVRVGSSMYFTQVYYGKYYKNGNFIKGYYTREDGHRGLWEAVRKK